MKGLLGRSAPPIGAVVAMVVFLATGCATGQGVPSGATSPTSPVGGPTLTPTVRPSQSDAATGPTASPSSTSAPLLWTQASLKEDWPGPVRTEPAGGAIVVPLQEKADGVPDPLGDTGSADHPWVDIQELRGRVLIDLGSNRPPFVDPIEQWIAYGVVVDDDRDGVPDRRFGIDNIPGTTPDNREHRVWITDLHTGRTEAAVGPPYVGEIYDSYFPGEIFGGAKLSFGGGDIAGGGSRPGLLVPFYAWASVIENGRVVATDYAPDVGWLDPSATAKP